MTSPLVYEIFAPGGVVLEQGSAPPALPAAPVEDQLAQLLVDYAESRSMNLFELDGLTIRGWDGDTAAGDPWELQGSEWRR